MVLFFTVFLLSLVVLLFLEKYSHKFGFIDQPGLRKIHQNAIPRNGGFVIFAACTMALILFKNNVLGVLLWPMAIIYSGGVIDDFRKETPVYVKLLFQCTGAFVFLYQMELPFALKVVLFVFQVAITNSFNLLDNMNGITIVLSSGLFVLFTYFSESLRNSFTVFYFASALAFLIRNYPTGKIFLGDQGSQFLGFLISSVFIITFINQPALNYGAFLNVFEVVMFIFGVFCVFIADTFWVMYIRTKNKKSIFQGDQNHLSHNLYKKGASALAIPWILAAVQITIGFLSLFVWQHLILR